jgi:hypothetical protein
MVVMTMTAMDYDDPNEGTNAKLTYSIEKNVIDEEQNRPIFEIEPDTGVIKTAVCCLDREKTPDYSIQVVAMDGGGLKGKICTFTFTKRESGEIETYFDFLFCIYRYGDSVYTCQRHQRHGMFLIGSKSGGKYISIENLIIFQPPHFTKDEWFTEVDETDGASLPDTPILTVTVHDEDETNKFHYKVCFLRSLFNLLPFTKIHSWDLMPLLSCAYKSQEMA